MTAGVVWNNRSEAVSVEMVSGNYFGTLGVQSAAGRLILPSDETSPAANPVAVLNFDYWKAHLAEAHVEGKTLIANGTPFTILGVSAPGFRSAVWGRLPDVYVPITMQRTVEPEWIISKTGTPTGSHSQGASAMERRSHGHQILSTHAFFPSAERSSRHSKFSQPQRARNLLMLRISMWSRMQGDSRPMDVHAEKIAVAVAEPDGDVRSLATIANREDPIRKFIRKLGSPEHLRACMKPAQRVSYSTGN
jgi:MacB-like periplasmic core domain